VRAEQTQDRPQQQRGNHAEDKAGLDAPAAETQAHFAGIERERMPTPCRRDGDDEQQQYGGPRSHD